LEENNLIRELSTAANSVADNGRMSYVAGAGLLLPIWQWWVLSIA